MRGWGVPCSSRLDSREAGETRLTEDEGALETSPQLVCHGGHQSPWPCSLPGGSCETQDG